MQTLVVVDLAGLFAHYAGQHPPQSLPLAVPLLIAPPCNQAEDSLSSARRAFSFELQAAR